MQEWVGKLFADWTVISYEGKRDTERHWYKVKCKCGNESIVERNILKSGKSTKCRSCARKISTKGEKNGSHRHGYSSLSHPHYYLYTTWVSMKQRCFNPKVKNYHRYGGRGITVCDEWKNSFENFLKDMGERPEGYCIDRIDNEKGYFKENCRWVTNEENCNNREVSALHEYKGETLSETQWAKRLGLSRNKFMWWARKNGVEWVINNLESLKKTRRGMSDQDYRDTDMPLPLKRFRR